MSNEYLKLSVKQMKMIKVKIIALQHHIGLAITGKLTRNFTACNFYLRCPKNGMPATLSFNGHLIGTIEKDSFKLNEFDKSIWGNEVYKHDIICEIHDEILKNLKEAKKQQKNGGTVKKQR